MRSATSQPSRCCFGVAPCEDGSIVIAAVDGTDMSVDHLEAARADSFSVLKFVGDRATSRRVCIASNGADALGLALAFAGLSEAEVILVRPAAISPVTGGAAGSARNADIAMGLARYARRAAT
jgi:hypothetical protein